MTNLSCILSEQTDRIVQIWVEAVAQDEKIQSADRLSRVAIRNHIPHVLEALITVLSKSQESDVRSIVQASLQHGALRAEQGFEPTELAREYRLLRRIILTQLEPSLLQETTAEALRAVFLVDAVIDEATAQCFDSYVKQRLQEVELIQSQLTLTNQELNRLLQANQEKLSLITHELKTPLSSIISYSTLFLQQTLSLQQQRSLPQEPLRDAIPSIEHIERVLRNGHRLLRMINDLLELSRSEMIQVQLELLSVDVRSLIQDVVEVVHPLAEARGLQLTWNADLAPQTVETDPIRLQQILTNLVTNAIRYTETGNITIHCQCLTESEWELSVMDTGVGIAPENQARVFAPFFRLPLPGQPASPDSTGLGLAIVAQLVKLLQGKISLKSELGVGSRFSVIMPMYQNQQAI
ncbi:MAG: HAMP domain-containing histidine kinase [Oculatellaceae cyanobacterium Prado106]|nr:HAMP domain-containing histidine kinase [Oculatellaceae cyanobacterium Prado106]